MSENKYKDNVHDADSCEDVWIEFYKPVYSCSDIFSKYFDFEKIDDSGTSKKCPRFYIKLNDWCRKEHPKFKLAGDCIFNFNNKKKERFLKYIKNSEPACDLLEKCSTNHHRFVNFALMPITGGMQLQKGSNKLDRPDVHIMEIYKYYSVESREDSNILNWARGNKESLIWYLSLFNKDIDSYIDNYIKEVYLIDDKNFIHNKFLKFANKKVVDEESCIEYMKMALEFWNLRNEYCKKLTNSQVMPFSIDLFN